MKIGIHLKLVALCLGVVFYSGLSLFYISDKKTEHSLEEQIGLNLQTKSSYVMNTIDHFIYERLSDIQDIAEEPIFLKEEPLSEVSKRMKIIKKHYPLYESFSFFDTSRVRLVDTDGIEIGKKHSLSKYWHKLEKGEVVMDISKSEATQEIVMHFASTVYNEKGDKIGYIVSRVLIDELYKVFGDMVSKTELGSNILIDLIDQDGTILYSNNHPELVLKATHPKLDVVKNYLIQEEESIEKHSFFKTEKDIFLYSEEKGYMDYEGSHWALVMSVPKSVAFAPAEDLKNTLIQFFIPILLLAVFLAFLFSQYLSRPLVMLTNVAREYGKGNFDVDFKISTNDEREVLASSLQWMASQLKQKMEQQSQLNSILSSKFKEVSAQKNRIEDQQEEIQASLRYAQHMQEAMLPPLDDFKNEFFNLSVFYQPLKLVSGDFYYFERVVDENGKNCFVVASIDCTGHGVPGAFMTIIANNLLQQIIHIERNTVPSVILEKLHLGVKKALHQQDKGSIKSQGRYLNDGMDIALCTINTDDRTVTYSGAYRPCLHVHQNKVNQLKGARCSIGGSRDLFRERYGLEKSDKIFTDMSFSYEKGDTIFMFSDGITDQFGFESNQKYSVRRLQKKIEENHQELIKDQLSCIQDDLQTWRGSEPQTDDMVLIGLRFLH